jgi:RimJ/RimL family protein N-acetyltransferase
MKAPPVLTTHRLLLRFLDLADAPEVTRLVGEREIAATTLQIPYPYEEGMAAEWIAPQREQWERGEQATFAMVRREDDRLVGAIGLGIQSRHHRAELGYWVGRSFWGNGLATEAARGVVAYGFDELGLERIYAYCMKDNPASARVLRKAGMTLEGCLRRHVEKWGEFKDLEVYGILRGS